MTHNGAIRIAGANQRQGPFKFILAPDIELIPKAYLIDGFVGLGETSAWYGAPDSGKSCVAIDVACHIAAGRDWCGRHVQPGAVLYVAAERGAVVKRRVVAWCSHHQAGNIPLAIVSEAIDLRTNQIDTDRIIATAIELRDMVKQDVVLIIIETLNRVLAGGDENASKDMGLAIAAIDRIQRATGAHIAVVHHVPVDRTDRMRGHGSVLGAVDLTVRITKTDKAVTVEADKANDLPEKPRHTFEFESIELMRDENSGQITTAPVLVPADPAIGQNEKNTGRRWTRGLHLIRESISAALIDNEAIEHRVASDGPLVRAIFVDHARAVHRQRYINGGDGDRTEAERKAWHRNIKEARNRNLIGSGVVNERELVWLASGVGHGTNGTPLRGCVPVRPSKSGTNVTECPVLSQCPSRIRKAMKKSPLKVPRPQRVCEAYLI